MADQKVTVRVEAQKMSGADKPFKDIAREAAGAEKAVKSLGRAQNELQGGGTAGRLKNRGLGYSHGINSSIGRVAGGAGMEVSLALQSFEKIGKAGNDVSGALALLSGRATDAAAAFENGLLGPAVQQTASAFESASGELAKLMAWTRGKSTDAGSVRDELAGGMGVVQERLGRFGAAGRLAAGAIGVPVNNASQALTREMAEKRMKEEEAAQRQLMLVRAQLQQRGGQQRGKDELAGLRTPEEQRKYFRSQQDEARMVLGNANERGGAAGQAERESAQKRIVEMAKAERDITLQLIADRQKMVDTAKQLLEVEKERLKDSSAAFGAMSAGEQRRSMRIAEKIASGGELSRGETAFARGKGFFDGQLRDRDAAKGDAAGFEAFAKLLGLDKGVNKAKADMAAAEKLQVELKSQLELTLKVEFDQAGKAMSDRVAEELKKLMAIEAQRSAAEIARQAETVKAQQRAANPT